MPEPPFFYDGLLNNLINAAAQLQDKLKLRIKGAGKPIELKEAVISLGTDDLSGLVVPRYINRSASVNIATAGFWTTSAGNVNLGPGAGLNWEVLVWQYISDGVETINAEIDDDGTDTRVGRDYTEVAGDVINLPGLDEVGAVTAATIPTASNTIRNISNLDGVSDTEALGIQGGVAGGLQIASVREGIAI